jgi:hypothetical protein
MGLALHFFAGPLQACDDYPSLSAEEALALTARLKRKAVVRGNFKQERIMAILDRPLLADGSMLYAPEQGLLWNVDHPFSYQLILTDDYLIQVNQSDKQIVESSDQPLAFSMARIFSQILSGNVSGASEYFSVYGNSVSETDRDASWILCLRPLNAPINRWLDRIYIQGDQFIKQVRLVDLNQDFTRITFSDIASSPGLNDAERRSFSRP